MYECTIFDCVVLDNAQCCRYCGMKHDCNAETKCTLTFKDEDIKCMDMIESSDESK